MCCVQATYSKIPEFPETILTRWEKRPRCPNLTPILFFDCRALATFLAHDRKIEKEFRRYDHLAVTLEPAFLVASKNTPSSSYICAVRVSNRYADQWGLPVRGALV